MTLKLSVIGTGYLGATHAACMASLGFEVIGFDTEASKIDLLSKGKVPFYEPDLEELLAEQIKAGRLSFTKDIAELSDIDVHFICVGTPQVKGGNAADLTYVNSALESIAKIVSKRFTGRVLSIEHKKKIGDFWRGKKRNKEFGLKISAAQKGREGTHKGWITVTNGEFEKRIKSIDECPIGWKRGRKNAVRESISLTQTGTILSDKTRQKMSDAKKGKTPWNKGLRNKLN